MRPSGRTSAHVLVALVSLLAVHVALQMGFAAPAPAPTGGAEARVYAAFSAGQGLGGTAARLDRSPRRGAEIVGLADPLGSVGRVSVFATARRVDGRSQAAGRVEARDLTLFSGRVTIALVEATVTGEADAVTQAARVEAVRVTGAVVDGAPVEVAADGVLQVPGAGLVRVGVTDLADAGQVRLNAIEVHGPDAAAPPLVVGHVDLRVVAGPDAVAPPREEPRARPTPDPDVALDPPAPRDPPVEAPPATTPPSGAPLPGAPAAEPPVAVSPLPSAPADPAGPAPRLLPGTPGVSGPATVGGGTAAFPVAGTYSYIDDYGFPRAGTGWHRGNDVFAPVGTPVVAVREGVVSRVGWNSLGGNRLWLTDVDGTAYYYAHLSAYSPLAVEGGRVRAGDVLGYVGNTGQAASTPPHLHFEVHPGGQEAESVNPYTLLQAWERGEASSLSTPEAVEVAPDAAAGAVVVGVAPERDAAPGQGTSGQASAAR